MKRYSDEVLSAATGLPLVGTSITVYLAGTKTKAPLYKNNNTAGEILTNPIISSNGGFYFFALDGRYDFLIQNSRFSKSISGVDIYDLQSMAEAIALLSQQGAGAPLVAGPFSALKDKFIPNGIDILETSGPDGGTLIADNDLTDADVAAYSWAITKTKNGRYFRRDVDDLNVLQAGADRKGVIDSLPAFKAVQRYAQLYAVNPEGGVLRASAQIVVPIGTFKWAQTWEMDGSSFRFVGFGNKRCAASRILVGIGQSAVIVQRHDTTGSSGGSVLPIRFGAEGMYFEGLCFESMGGGTSNTHGINARATLTITRCIIREFAGNGLHSLTAAGSTDFQGNANLLEITNNTFTSNGGSGCFLGGSDGNAGINTGNDYTSNGRYGLVDASLYGNFTAGNHFNANGVATFGGNAANASSVYRYGPTNTRYFVMPGMGTLARTTVPGTLGPQGQVVWGLFPAGPGVEIGHPLWVNGVPAFEGGPCAFTSRLNGQTVVGNYTESGQAPAVFARGVISIGNNFHQAVGIVEASPGEGYINLISQNGALSNDNGFYSNRNGTTVSFNMNGYINEIITPELPAGLQMQRSATDVRVTYGGSDANELYRYLGPGTNNPAGPLRFFTDRLAIGIGMESAITTSRGDKPAGNSFPRGAIVWNCYPDSGEPNYWRRRMDGVWVDGPLVP